MLALTPAERRGALTVALLLVIGAGYDLWRARAPLAPLSPPSSSDPQHGAVMPSFPAADTSDTSDEAVAPVKSLRAAASARVDLNRAGAAELDRLPGIGPVLAHRIVEHRTQHGPFRAVDDLLAVSGIGPALFARLVPLVTIGPDH